jgi:hypothetical protein
MDPVYDETPAYAADCLEAIATGAAEMGPASITNECDITSLWPKHLYPDLHGKAISQESVCRMVHSCLAARQAPAPDFKNPITTSM